MDPINLQIVFVDGTTAVVSTTAADLIAFESRFDLSVARLSSEIRLTHLFFIAWHVQHRTKVTELDFEKWTEGVSLVKEAESKK
jgi:hypothetical protein